VAGKLIPRRGFRGDGGYRTGAPISQRCHNDHSASEIMRSKRRRSRCGLGVGSRSRFLNTSSKFTLGIGNEARGRETPCSKKCLIDGTTELAQFRDRRPLGSRLWPTPRVARPILPRLAGIASPASGTRPQAPSPPVPTEPAC
jgi:hypothetical protein